MLLKNYFPKVDKKLQNLDILILHAADTPKHLFAGKERVKHEKFLGDKGILVHTKYSNKALIPRIVLRVLFNYILSSGGQKLANDHAPYETKWIFNKKNVDKTPKTRVKSTKTSKNITPVEGE